VGVSALNGVDLVCTPMLKITVAYLLKSNIQGHSLSFKYLVR